MPRRRDCASGDVGRVHRGRARDPHVRREPRSTLPAGQPARRGFAIEAKFRRNVKLTFCVKRDLYVGNGDGSRPFEGGSSRVAWGRNATAIGEPGPGACGQAGCETEIEIGDEIIRVPGATDAPSAAWPLALPSLALSRRPALACARAARCWMLLERPRASHDGPSHDSSPASRWLSVPGGGTREEEGRVLSHQTRARRRPGLLGWGESAGLRRL